MNRLRLVCIAGIASFAAACSSAPDKPATPAVTQVGGDWLVHMQTPMGAFDMNMKLVQVDKSFTGTLDSLDKSLAIHVDCQGTVNGNEIKLFYLYVPQGVEMRVNFLGTVADRSMSGRIRTSTPVGDAPESTFTAQRE